jgi:predicted secreted protein
MLEQIIRHKYFFHIIAVIVILTAAILFIAFSGTSEEQNDTADTIKAVAGEEFVITSDANVTTGYGWELSSPIDGSLISFARSEYVPAKTGLAGSGGKSIWTFKALRSGKARISFKYIRPWEKDTPPAKIAAYVIDISE